MQLADRKCDAAAWWWEERLKIQSVFTAFSGNAKNIQADVYTFMAGVSNHDKTSVVSLTREGTETEGEGLGGGRGGECSCDDQ